MVTAISEIEANRSLCTAITMDLRTETAEIETTEDRPLETTGMSSFKDSD